MGRRMRFRVLVPGVAVLALLLGAPAAALAVKAPGLASSSQYKAFIEYVKKLDGLASRPTSTEQKNTYEAKLTAKKTAAAHKANALFKRASEEAKAEANETAKEQVEGVRGKEDRALEALRLETNQKLDRTEASFHIKFERIATGHKNREKALKGQIAELRSKKAAAAPGSKARSRPRCAGSSRFPPQSTRWSRSCLMAARRSMSAAIAPASSAWATPRRPI